MGLIDEMRKLNSDGYEEEYERVNEYWKNYHKQEIIDERKRREKDLVGKYLVSVTSRYQSNLELFLQDDRYGSGHWTKFLSNAKAFHDESAAITKARNLQFNNPRVVLVQANGKLKEVYSNGKCTRQRIW